MENAEEVFQSLEDFTKRRPKVIPRELEEYLHFVARTGDPVYQWALVKNLFKEKLLNVITEFFESSPGLDIPNCPNVDIFTYETMKNSLLEKIDAFSSAPFTVQRICELLTSPRKQYSRIDKYMRAFEKNILVVSTRDPGPLRRPESENGEGTEAMVNGSDSNSDYNVDVEMEDMSSWKENSDPLQTYSAQASSSDADRKPDSSVSPPFIAQNGPAREQTSSDVELMTVEPDTPLALEEDTPPPLEDDTPPPLEDDTPPPLEDDTPESSTSESDLSPSEEETKNDDELPPKPSEEPIITVTVPAEDLNVEPTPAIDESIETDAEPTDDSEKEIVNPQETEKLECVSDMTVSPESDSPLNETINNDESISLTKLDPVEPVVIEEPVITSNIPLNSIPDVVEESLSLPETSSEEITTQPESMESQETEVLPVLVDDSAKVTESPETESIPSVDMPQSPSIDMPPSPNVDCIEDSTVEMTAPVESTVNNEKVLSPVQNITHSIIEAVPEESAPEQISVDPEITVTEKPLISLVISSETKASDSEVVENEPIVEADVDVPEPISSPQEESTDASISSDS